MAFPSKKQNNPEGIQKANAKRNYEGIFPEYSDMFSALFRKWKNVEESITFHLSLDRTKQNPSRVSKKRLTQYPQEEKRWRQSSSDTVSSLVESPTQLTNAVNDIQRLPSETVRSVSSLVESSTSNTEDEIQRSLIELGKN